MIPELGKLERVDLRTIWESENVDFTPWLAKEENLEMLGETIGISLELEATERNVGLFRADILCKTMGDDSNESWVLIENQLERTNHTHIGQLLTYAAGLDAVTIVWVASKFTEQHRATLDWLNKITDEEFRFFGLEVEAWKIGDSRAAPKFNVISKPNNWSKSISHGARTINEGELGETKAMQLRYWQSFEKYLQDEGSTLSPQNSIARSWQRFTIGVTSVAIESVMNISENKIRVELNIQHPDHVDAYFNLLFADKEAIEQEIGFELVWREMPEKKGSKITIYKDADAKDEESWGVQHAWLKETVENFDRVFRERVKNLDPNDWSPESDIE